MKEITSVIANHVQNVVIARSLRRSNPGSYARGGLWAIKPWMVRLPSTKFRINRSPQVATGFALAMTPPNVRHCERFTSVIARNATKWNDESTCGEQLVVSEVEPSRTIQFMCHIRRLTRVVASARYGPGLPRRSSCLLAPRNDGTSSLRARRRSNPELNHQGRILPGLSGGNVARVRGITALELVVVIGIAALVAGLVIVSFSGVRTQKLLDGEAAKVIALFDEARERTLASRGGNSYGVHIESNRAVLFIAPTYDPAAPGNEEVSVDARLRITDIAFAGGGNDIIFARLSGDVAAFGTFDIELADDAAVGKRVNVGQSGVFGLDTL